MLKTSLLKKRQQLGSNNQASHPRYIKSKGADTDRLHKAWIPSFSHLFLWNGQLLNVALESLQEMRHKKYNRFQSFSRRILWTKMKILSREIQGKKTRVFVDPFETSDGFLNRSLSWIRCYLSKSKKYLWIEEDSKRGKVALETCLKFPVLLNRSKRIFFEDNFTDKIEWRRKILKTSWGSFLFFNCHPLW